MCLALLLAACAPISAEDDADVHLTWEKAVVVLPDGRYVGLEDEAFRAFARGRRFPVILYLHGSGGLGGARRSPALADYARRLNAILVAPDSMARPDRTKHRATLWFAARQREIEHALARLRESPWADRANVFAIGLSEGAIALAGYDKPGFRAAVITGYNCGRYRASIELPPDVPVLNAQHAQDPVVTLWQRGAGTCENALRDRPGSEVFGWQAPAVHDGNSVQEVRDKVVEFLKRNMR